MNRPSPYNSPYNVIAYVMIVTFIGTIFAFVCAKNFPDQISYTSKIVKGTVHPTNDKEDHSHKHNDNSNNQNTNINNFFFKKTDQSKNSENDMDEGSINHMKDFPRLYAKSLKSPLYSREFPSVKADVKRQAAVKEAFLHAWKSYSNACWGSDEFYPLSNSCGNSNLGGGLTIIDSLSTLAVMGLKEELLRARDFVEKNFRPDGGWSLFEFIIRYLGGMLSAGELTGDPIFINTSIAIGKALLPIMQETGGFYGSSFHFKTNGPYQFSANGGQGGYCLAEAGTFQLEFFTLSRLTGDKSFINVASNVYKTLWKQNPDKALISPHLGAGTDSYYEYIPKAYVMTGGVSEEMIQRHMMLMKDVRNSLLFKSLNRKLVGTGIRHGGSINPTIEHLATFVGGMVAVGAVNTNSEEVEDIKLAGQLADTYASMYNNFKSGIMPEHVRFNVDDKNNPNDMTMTNDGYILRPETVESIYIMWKFTGLQKYRDYNWRIFKAINRTCRVAHGFASISNLNSENPRHENKMESFFLAETLKYLYLTFSDSHLISPAEWVFNTEAHPIRIWDKETTNKFKDLLNFGTKVSEKLKE